MVVQMPPPVLEGNEAVNETLCPLGEIMAKLEAMEKKLRKLEHKE